MKNFSLLFFLLFCSLFLVTSCDKTPKVAKIGKMAPDFTLVDRQGKEWTLSKLKGQVVFVNFWATWCPPCVEEMPSMQKLYALLPNDNFKMLAILTNDDPRRADLFAAKSHISIPILNNQTKNIGTKYGLTGVPETFIVDKKGIIREKFIGPAPWDSVGAVQMLMKYINQ